VEIDAPLILARWTYYCATTVLFGWSLFPLYAGPSRDEAARALPRTVATVLAAAALTAAILWLLFFAAALGEPEDAAETMRTILFDSGFGPAWLVRLSGVALALVAALAGRPRLIIAAMLIALACEGWSGHAATWGLAGSLVQAVHVVCAGAWIGGLAPLALLIVHARKKVSDVPLAETALRQFSRFGVIFVAGIALTGLVNAWHMLDGGPDLTRAYDRVLFAKVALFAMMVGVAALNRYRLANRFVRSDPASLLWPLSRNIAIEQLIGVAVLLDVSALGLMNPHA
jgi:putative copper resistance protein D